MQKQIFVNLPVRDLEKSKAFFAALGYQFNPQFSDDNAACMIISDTIFVMLLVEAYFKSFTHKPVCNGRACTGSILALSMDSREEVDAMLEKALAAGGSEPMQARDYGFMYQRGYEDLDGQLWEVLYMDPAHVQ